MSLSINIKRFRRDHGISQEYMGEKLAMSQATYSRLENNNAKCVRHLACIAEALGITPESLHHYHLAEPLDLPPDTDVSKETLLAEKEDALQSKEDYIQFLTLFIKYTQTVLQKFWGGRVAGDY